MLCSEAVKVNSNQIGGQAVTLKCKRWTCPLCRPDNRRRVIAAVKRGEPDKFMTLTMKHSLWETPDQCAQAMRDAFAKLIRKIRKRWPSKRTEYFRVFEAHKTGWPHLHILMRAPYIPQAWLKSEWEQLTGAFKVDIRVVKTKDQAAYYIAKYVGKDLHRFAGVTRYFKSREYEVIPKEDRKLRAFGSQWFKVDRAPQFYFWQQALELERRGSIITERRLGFMSWENVIGKG